MSAGTSATRGGGGHGSAAGRAGEPARRDPRRCAPEPDGGRRRAAAAEPDAGASRATPRRLDHGRPGLDDRRGPAIARRSRAGCSSSVGMAAATIAVAGVRAVAWLVAPVFLALVVVVALAPVQSWLRRMGVPRWLATTVLLLLVWAVLLAFVALLVLSAAQFAALLPDYAGRAEILHQRGGRRPQRRRDGVRPAVGPGPADRLRPARRGGDRAARPAHQRRQHPGAAAVGPGLHGDRVQRLRPADGADGRRAAAPAGGDDPVHPGHPQLPAGQHRVRRGRGRGRLDRAVDHRGAGRALWGLLAS